MKPLHCSIKCFLGLILVYAKVSGDAYVASRISRYLSHSMLPHVSVAADWRSSLPIKTRPILNITPAPTPSSTGDTLMATLNYSLPSSISSMVFACIATVIFIAFMIWRGVRVCGVCCCKCDRFLPDPNGFKRKDEYLKGKGMSGVKVTGVILGTFLITVELYGLITTVIAGRYNNNNVVQHGWNIIDSMVVYIASTVVALRELMYNLNVAGSIVLQILNLTNTTACKYLSNPLPPNFSEQAFDLTYQSQEVTYKAGMTADAVYQSLVQTYIDVHGSWEQTTLTLWNYLVTGYIVVIATVLLVTLIYVASMIFNHKTGLVWTTSLNLFLSVLFFVLCISFTIGLASLKASCDR